MLKKRKPQGEEKILNEGWLFVLENLRKGLYKVLNVVWKRGLFQKLEKRSNSSNIKKDDKDQAQNYHGITLLSLHHKILLKRQNIGYQSVEKKKIK